MRSTVSKSMAAGVIMAALCWSGPITASASSSDQLVESAGPRLIERGTNAQRDVCTGEHHGDYVHRSSSAPYPASGHGWWTATSCKPGVQADVTVQLQILRSGTWRNVGAPATKRVYAGGGSANRANPRVNCTSSSTSSWRSVIDVDLIGYVDTPDKLETPSRSLNCSA